MEKETLDRVDSLLEESIKYSHLRIEIEGRLNALVPLVAQWEKELKKMIKEDQWIEMIRIQEKHIVQLHAKIELLTELKKAL
jgi:hypothetical protein